MLIYFTDFHVSEKQPINRIGNVFDDSINKLEQIILLSKKYKAKIIHGGDLFHEHDPSFNLVNRILNLLVTHKTKIYGIVGNHDIEGTNTELKNTAIYTLKHTGYYKDISELNDDEYNFIPVDYTKDFSVINNINRCAGKYNVVVSHLPIAEKECIFDSIPIDTIKLSADLYLCGHLHFPFEIKKDNSLFINPGCITRRAISEKEIVPTVVLFDSKQHNYITLKYNKDTFVKQEDTKIELFDGNKSELIKFEKNDLIDVINKSKYSKEAKEECINRIAKYDSK